MFQALRLFNQPDKDGLAASGSTNPSQPARDPQLLTVFGQVGTEGNIIAGYNMSSTEEELELIKQTVEDSFPKDPASPATDADSSGLTGELENKRID
jgi:hypothetical protein